VPPYGASGRLDDQKNLTFPIVSLGVRGETTTLAFYACDAGQFRPRPCPHVAASGAVQPAQENSTGLSPQGTGFASERWGEPAASLGLPTHHTTLD
jgi:hypothetical protein